MSELGTAENPGAQADGRRRVRRERPARAQWSLSEALKRADLDDTSEIFSERDAPPTQTTVIAPRRAVQPPEGELSRAEPLRLELEPDVEPFPEEDEAAVMSAPATTYPLPPWLEAKRRARRRASLVNGLAWTLTLAFTAAVIGGAAFLIATCGACGLK